MTAIGKYQIQEEIGSSAAAKLYKARDKFRNREVALKVYDVAAGPEAPAKDQFCRELGVCADLHHPHIAAILDTGEVDGSIYVATELLYGADLRRHFQERRVLPLNTKLEYMAHVCDALATAHRSGIAHGNIKPSNLFLVAGEDLRILDFGTGRWVASILGAGGRLPNLDAHHLAPEQILGDFFDARSDVFSVALILYQLLTDKYPFPVPDAVVPREIVHTEPAPLRQLDPQIPEALEQLVASALHKDPQQRLQTAGAFAAALRAIAAPPRPASIPMPVQQLAPPAPPPASTPQPAKPRAKKPGSTRKRVLTYIVAGVLALGITGTLLLRKGVDASPAPAAAAPSVPAKPEAEQAVQSKPAETPTRPVAPTPIVSPPSPEEQAQLSSVKSLWESGQYEQAMTLVNQVLAKNANSSGAKSWRRKIRAAQDAEAAIK